VRLRPVHPESRLNLASALELGAQPRPRSPPTATPCGLRPETIREPSGSWPGCSLRPTDAQSRWRGRGEPGAERLRGDEASQRGVRTRGAAEAAAGDYESAINARKNAALLAQREGDARRTAAL